jgi:hypothetical protein
MYGDPAAPYIEHFLSCECMKAMALELPGLRQF